MKTILKLTAIMPILVGSLASCEKKENEPIEIPFTEYLLEGTSCQWKNFEPNKVTIINSNEEFKQHFDCSNGNCPEIDFSKNTLLLVEGCTSSSPADVIKIQLQKNYNSEYSIYLEVRQGVLGCVHTKIYIFVEKWRKDSDERSIQYDC